MTAREIIRRRLAHEGTDITPYSVFFEAGIHQKLTEYYGDPNWMEKKLRQFACYHLFVDTVQMKAIDEVYARDGYGALWRMDREPAHLERPPLAEPLFDGYAFPRADLFVEPIRRHKEAAVRAYEADNELYRIINMGWGIFEHSWRVRGFENALADMLLEPDFYKELTEKITALYLDMLRECADVPADAYLFGDDWGEQRGVIMGAETWRRFIKPCWEKIYREVHRQGKVAIQHSCGSIAEIYDDLIEIGMDCHESVQPEAAGMAPDRLKRDFGSRLSFWGCLGTQGLLQNGTPEEIRREIFHLRDLFREDGGYVLAPAKPLSDGMPLENAVAVVETLAELNA